MSRVQGLKLPHDYCEGEADTDEWDAADARDWCSGACVQLLAGGVATLTSNTLREQIEAALKAAAEDAPDEVRAFASVCLCFEQSRPATY